MLLPTEPSGLLTFGDAVAIEGDVAVVGATDNSPGPGYVNIYIKKGATWILDDTLSPPDPLPFDNFGRSVEIAGDVVITSGRDSGVVVCRCCFN